MEATSERIHVSGQYNKHDGPTWIVELDSLYEDCAESRRKETAGAAFCFIPNESSCPHPCTHNYRSQSQRTHVEQGRIELTDSENSDNLRLEFQGIHFISNGSIYGFAEPSG